MTPDRFDPTLAAIRFGCGLSPRHSAPETLSAMMADLAGPDMAARTWPIPTFGAAHPSPQELSLLRRATQAEDEAEAQAAQQVYQEGLSAARDLGARALLSQVRRAVHAPHALRERLTLFWTDHFALKSRNFFTSHLIPSFVEEAIRPHLTGRFADMLFAVTTHPLMLLYLDQQSSVGPNSPAGQGGLRGLNENLAREVLELHSLGVGGGYDQRDVTQLAELLTGLRWVPGEGTVYQPRRAEPGAETVLGRTYGAEADLSVIRAVLDDLAAHPATARHLARKLAVHFVSDTPDPGLVSAMAGEYTRWGGNLGAMVAAMLDHPAAWGEERVKVRQPMDFMLAGLRALAPEDARLAAGGRQEAQVLILRPSAAMGQSWQRPPGPNGWPEEAAAWATAQGLAARIAWAMAVPERVLDELPDPRAFLFTALGPQAPGHLGRAAAAAEDRAAGIGLILSSPAFQRR